MATNIKLSTKDTQINLPDPLNSSNGLAGDQAHSEITALPNGDFVVVYENSYAGGTDHDIMAAEFTADGTIVGTGPYRLEFDGGDQLLPDVAPRLGGGIVAVWEDDAASNSISLAVVPPGTGPNPSELTVFDPGYKLYAPTVGTYADGSYLVAWEAHQPTHFDVQYALVNAAGTSASAPVTIPDPGLDFNGRQQIATSGNQAMLVWAHGNAERVIEMELINSNGTHSTDKLVEFHQFENLDNPDVAALADGRFVIVWQRMTTNDVQGKIYDPTTDTFTPTFTVSNTGGDQTNPKVAALPDGGFFVTWADNSHAIGYDYYGTGIDGQRFDSTGTPDGDAFQVNIWSFGNDQYNPAVAANASGHVAAVWTNDDHNAFLDNSGSGIAGQFMHLTTDVVNGTAGNDTLTTYSLGETINGLDGADVIFAAGGNDTINGGGGSDQIFGQDGNDLLDGGTGADVMVGGLGNDRYVVDNPGDLVVEQPGEGIDSVTSSIDYTLPANVERLVLSGGAVNGAGNDLDNIIFGNTGDNVLTGGGGNDVIDGGAGDDTAVYSGARAQYHIDQLPNGVFQITDLRPGSPDGVDKVHGVEHFAFSGGTVTSAALTTPPGVQWAGSPDLGSRGPDWHVASVADFNADGTSDILWQNVNTGHVDEWHMALGQWSASTDLGSRGADWQVVGTGDFNHDGTGDILWRNVSTGQLDEWKMANGNWAGSTDLGSHGADWQVAGTGDFNGDGTSDILFRNSVTGQVDEWTMANGNWAGSTDLGSHGTDWQVAGTGDFNHDGNTDVLWRNSTTGQVDAWKMAGGNWAGSIDLGTHGPDWQVAAVNDFNGDGTSDVLWRNPATGEMDGWIMQNGNWAGSVSVGSFDPAYQVVGSGDFNHSGTADVLWHNAMTGQTSEWLLAAV